MGSLDTSHRHLDSAVLDGSRPNLHPPFEPMGTASVPVIHDAPLAQKRNSVSDISVPPPTDYSVSPASLARDRFAMMDGVGRPLKERRGVCMDPNPL